MLGLMECYDDPEQELCQQYGCDANADYVVGRMESAGYLSHARLLCPLHAQLAYDELVARDHVRAADVYAGTSNYTVVVSVTVAA